MSCFSGATSGLCFSWRDSRTIRVVLDTCVHLYINEEAIRASEDNSRHLYNAVVSYRPQSRHQTMVDTQNILEHLYDEPPFEGPQQQSMPHLHQISQTPSGNKVHTVHCQSSAINPTRFMEEGIGDCHPNHVRMMSDGGRPCHSSTSTLNHRTTSQSWLVASLYVQ